MTKTVFRYFLDFAGGQERWLNRMAQKGYRLQKCGKAWYTFETDQPNPYEYAVELIGDRSHKAGQDYKAFLESMGYRLFYKNINLNVSFGKATWRPWAKGTGQIASSPGGFNKELLIVEKLKDGKPFALHTERNDLLSGYQSLRNAYLWGVIQMLALALMILLLFFYQEHGGLNSRFLLVALLPVVLVFLYAVPLVKYSRIICKLKQESNAYE
ncbi:MAG: hypothetical protein K0R57_3486 [Paenibacillaceae bacterium]|jgi:hypothetical protein|nr:hypothetical protein [Paenibacillaceae bacterium]